MNSHAFSYLSPGVGIFQSPAICGGLGSFGLASARVALNGYEAPRVVRLYSPSRTSPFRRAMTFEPYWSKLMTSCPSLKLPLVEAIRSSPLTNVPVGRPGVPPMTNRNGTSAWARLTMAASQSPASDACLEHEAASAAMMTTDPNFTEALLLAATAGREERGRALLPAGFHGCARTPTGGADATTRTTTAGRENHDRSSQHSTVHSGRDVKAG